MAKNKKAEAPGIGDNSEAYEAALLAITTRFRAHRNRIEEAQAALKSVKKAFKVDRDAASREGFTLKIIDEALDLETMAPREVQRQATERRLIFETLGLPLGATQQDLFGGANDTVRDEKFWGDHGYNWGLKGLPATPPPEIPPALHQHWLKRRVAGEERLAWAMAECGLNPEARSGIGAADRPTTAADIAARPEDADDMVGGDPLLA